MYLAHYESEKIGGGRLGLNFQLLMPVVDDAVAGEVGRIVFEMVL
jgi:hypothetical protein